MSAAGRHLHAVPTSVSAPAPLVGTVSIPAERYAELLLLEILATEVAAKTWQHQHRGHATAKLGMTVALASSVRPEFVEQYLPEHEREAFRASQEES